MIELYRKVNGAFEAGRFPEKDMEKLTRKGWMKSKDTAKAKAETSPAKKKSTAKAKINE